MPQYTFYCKPCNLQFKRRLSVGPNPDHKCPSCALLAERHLEGFGFEFAASKGTSQANSGVAKHDYPTADNLVGRSAEQRWATMHARNRAKAQVREQGVALARRDLEGGVTEYTALGKEQFAARKALEQRFRTKAETDGIQKPFIPEKKV